MKQHILFAFFSLSMLITSQAQYRVPGMHIQEKQVEEITMPVYQFVLPLTDDMGKRWSKFVKDAAEVKISDRKNLWLSNNFEIPGTDREGIMRTWFAGRNDSTVMQVNLALGTDIYSNQEGFESENQFLLDLLAEFDYQSRKAYFETRLNSIKKKRKDLKKGIRRLSGYVKNNEKEIKDAKKEAKESPEKMNQILGSAKDLENKNEALRTEIDEKKNQLNRLTKEEKGFKSGLAQLTQEQKSFE